MSFESKVGKGTTFTIRLPIDGGATDEKDATTDASPTTARLEGEHESSTRKIASIESEVQRFRSILQAVPLAWAEHEMIFDVDGKPSDCVFLEINDAFEKCTGLTRSVIGRRVTEVIPGIRQATPDLVSTYGKVVTTGEKQQVEIYFELFDRWYSVMAFRHRPGHFVALFDDVTERRRTDRALVENERRYRSLFANLLEGYAHCRMLYENGEAHDFVYLDVNPSFERLTGMTGVAGKKVSELIPSFRESSPEMFATYARVASTGTPEKVEAYDDSRGLWLDVCVYSTEPGHFVVVFDDVSARKHSAESLRKSEERYRASFEGASVGKVLTAPTGRILEVNKAMASLLGYEAADLVGKTFAEITHPDDVAVSVQAMVALLRDPQANRRMEKRYLRKDGIAVWVDVNVAPLRDSAGKVTQFITHVIDISQRRHAEQMLSRSEQTLRRLVEGLKDEYFFYGQAPDGAFTYVSPSISSVLGHTPEEFMTVDFARLFRRSPHPVEIRHRDGSVHWLEISEFPVLDGEKILGVEGIAHDVTRRHRMEIELHQVRKLEAVGQLAAGIAHEINTPIQYIGDSISFLKESFEGLQRLVPRYREAIRALATHGHDGAVAEIAELEQDVDLDYVLTNGESAFLRCFDGIGRVSGIVRAMKEFAHPDLREKSPSDLNRALETTLTIARNEYKYVADVETDLGDVPPVLCNVGEMNQVFLNLIVNAGHAISDVVGTSGAKGKIRVITRREGDSVYVEIADTGPGIPESIRERVFEPFFTTKEVGKGSGQGLAIARSIVVEKHGGALTFDTAAGQGTVFRIRLPIGRSRGPA